MTPDNAAASNANLPGIREVTAALLYILTGIPESSPWKIYDAFCRENLRARGMVADVLAKPACRPATGLSRPGGFAARVGPVGPAAAAGNQLGNREPQAPTGRRH